MNIIKAGAGAGKTTTLIKILIKHIRDYYVEKQTFPRVAVSTFTRKATRELKERMIVKAIELNDQNLIQYVSYSPQLQISTLHGIFNQFIQTYGYIMGFSPGVSIMSEKESHELFVSILKNVLFEQKIGTTLLDHYSFEEMTAIVKQYISYIQNQPTRSPFNKEEMQKLIIDKKQECLNRMPVKQSGKYRKALLELEKEEANINIFSHLCLELQTLGQKMIPIWNQEKKALSQITLNDMETLTMAILNLKEVSLPSFAKIKQDQYKWDFWFLDEYQDISLIQNHILNKLSKDSQVFIVGDPQQSIYYFRGASTSVFQKKEEEAKQNKNSQVQYLTKNYRSCPELIAFFNDFFPEETFKKMDSVNDNYTKEKEVVFFNVKTKGSSVPNLEKTILLEEKAKSPAFLTTNLIRISSKITKEENEWKAVLNRVNNLLKQGVNPGEIAILARQNKALQQLAWYLKKHQLPIHLHSSGSFKNRREVTDALFLLRFLLNPHDNENLIGLLRTPYCRILDQTLVNWIQKNQQYQSLWNFCIKEACLQPIVRQLKNHLENTHKIGVTLSFQQALLDLSFIDLSYYQDPTGVREANIWKLIYCLKDYEQREQSNLFAFADYLFFDSMGTESDDNANYSQNAISAIESTGIQLMTIHSAKGLEFKHVILIKMGAGFRATEGLQYFMGDKETGKWTLSVKSKIEDKRIKSSAHKKIQEKHKENELKEFDRLLYVAMTRAKETLSLIGLEKPEKNSWAERFSFFSHLKPGSHQTKYYTYSVSED
ncbi:MAG: UvrD-helicase domain-containing protein [Bdellovibrionales bacterium]|nr:UvrD-helicase domain-containing protein [Bdellovibrionales bacterium]